VQLHFNEGSTGCESGTRTVLGTSVTLFNSRSYKSRSVYLEYPLKESRADLGEGIIRRDTHIVIDDMRAYIVYDQIAME
jgi:hypothetical protein